MRVVDVSDPAAPREIGFYDTPGRTDSLTVIGRHAYVVDGDLRIVDVANPAAPSEVGFYDIPGFAGSTLGIVVQDSYAYVTSQGVWMLDVSDPGEPVEVDAYPIAWGNVAMAGDTVYVIGNGLFILRSLRSVGTLTPRVFLPLVQGGKCETMQLP
jgi:hypothetical protein